MPKLEDHLSTQKRRQYTEEFKTEGVRLVEESGKPVAEIARNLGVADNRLYRWRNEAHHAAGLGTTRASHKAAREELARHPRKLDTMREERDFLSMRRRFMTTLPRRLF